MLPTLRAALALTLAAALAGCGEDPFAPDLAPQGEARFTYTGAIGGEFVASGQLNRRNPNAGSWAVGEVQQLESSTLLGVLGQQRREDLKVDGLVIEWTGARVGSVTCTATSGPCPFTAQFLVGTERFSGTFEASYGQALGTLTVTELTENRARGTFALTLRRPAQGDTPPPSIQASGSFDVPLNVLD